MGMGAQMALEMVLTMRDEASAEMQKVEKGLGGVNKAALAIGGAAVIAVGAFAKGMMDCVDAAAEEEVGLVRLQAQVLQTGAEWGAASAEIETYLAAQTKRVGLDDGEGRSSLTNLTCVTGDYKKAMDLLPVAIDLAKAKNIDLATATDLVGKVQMGNTEILKRYGIQLADNKELEDAHTAACKADAAAQEAVQKATLAVDTALRMYGPTSKQYLIAQQSVRDATNNAGLAHAKLVLATQEVSAAMDAAGSPMDQLSAKVKGQGEAFAQTAQGQMQIFNIQMGNLKETIGAAVLPAFTAVISTLATFAGDAIPRVEAALAQVQPIFEAVFSAISTVVQFAASIIQPIFDTFVAWFTGPGTAGTSEWGDHITMIFSMVQELIAAVMPVIQNVIETVWEAITAFWDDHGQAILKMVTIVFDMIKNTIQTAIYLVANILQLALDIIHGNWGNVWTDILAIIDTVWKGIKTAIGLAVEFIKTYLGLAWGIIKTTLETKWNEIKVALGEKWEAIKTLVNAKLDDAQLAIKTAWGDIKTTLETKWNEIKTALATKWEEIKTMIGTKLGDVAKAIKDEVAKWTTLGEELVAGLKQGVMNKAQDVINSVVGMVSDAISAAKRLLGISSPSTVMIGIGNQFGEGFGIGIGQQTGPVVSVAGGLGVAAMAAVAAAVAAQESAVRAAVNLVIGRALANASAVIESWYTDYEEWASRQRNVRPDGQEYVNRPPGERTDWPGEWGGG